MEYTKKKMTVKQVTIPKINKINNGKIKLLYPKQFSSLCLLQETCKP